MLLRWHTHIFTIEYGVEFRMPSTILKIGANKSTRRFVVGNPRILGSYDEPRPI